MTTTLSSGLLILDKPTGCTSFDCVHQVQRILQQRRVGHCGTLDPMAQGVLVLLFGPMTREQDRFLQMEKQYWFRAEFGVETETGDREGRQVARVPFAGTDAARLNDVLKSFAGDQWQIPPKYSAIKVGGKRLYEWARRGIDMPRPPRQITVYSFELLRLDGVFWEARVVCSRGTYVRSLVQDVAQKLGTSATLDALVRERVGPYTREAALSWDTLRSATRENLLTYSHAEIHSDARNV